MLLDRQRVKFWQRWVFAIMAIIMAGFLVMIPVSGNVGCNGSSSATEQIDKDIARYEAAVKAAPNDVDTWRLLGESYLARANQQAQGSAAQVSDWRSAAVKYERAITLLAKEKGAAARQLRVDSLDNLVSIYLFLKDYQMATSVYGQITELRPKDAESYFNMATVAIDAGDTNTALLAFTKFLELDPESPDAAAVRDWIAQNSTSSSPSPSPSSESGQ
ncbi:MAG: hypothetical protein WC709_06975 [Thermoleophilia bacterium]